MKSKLLCRIISLSILTILKLTILRIVSLISSINLNVSLSRFTFISICTHTVELSFDKNNYYQEAVGKARGTPLSHYNSFAAAMSGL